MFYFFFFRAEDGIRDGTVTGVQTCALPICRRGPCPVPADALDQETGRVSWAACARRVAPRSLETAWVRSRQSVYQRLGPEEYHGASEERGRHRPPMSAL